MNQCPTFFRLLILERQLLCHPFIHCTLYSFIELEYLLRELHDLIWRMDVGEMEVL